MLLSHVIDKYALIQGYIKDYMKALLKRVETKNPEQLDSFKKNVQVAVKKILDRHSDFQFYTGNGTNTLSTS